MVVSRNVSAPATAAARSRRSFWLRQVRYWHWMSSAICFIGMLGFALTGITLNHAAAIGANPETTTRTATLPGELVAALADAPGAARDPLPAPVARHLSEALAIDLAARTPEWSDDEVYVPLPRPGGDAFLTIDRVDGLVSYEQTDRGWIAYFNDLHKGRNTGPMWSRFLDLFAAGCVVFSVTGFVLLQIHAAQRVESWPMVALGLVIPLVVALVWIH